MQSSQLSSSNSNKRTPTVTIWKRSNRHCPCWRQTRSEWSIRWTPYRSMSRSRRSKKHRRASWLAPTALRRRSRAHPNITRNSLARHRRRQCKVSRPWFKKPEQWGINRNRRQMCHKTLTVQLTSRLTKMRVVFSISNKLQVLKKLNKWLSPRRGDLLWPYHSRRWPWGRLKMRLHLTKPPRLPRCDRRNPFFRLWARHRPWMDAGW